MPHSDPDKRRQYQREYQKRYQRKDRERQRAMQDRVKDRNRERIAAFKATGCATCGEDHPACLDLHHVNGDGHDTTANTMVQGLWSLERVERELARCVVLCANCHRKLHWEERQTLP